MKKIILSAFLLANLSFYAQVTQQTVTMGPNYANNVYYKLNTQTVANFPNNAWDLGFYRKSNMAFAIRINDAKNAQLFEASNNINDWATVSIDNQATWTELYNNDTKWVDGGAFEAGSATYGWGEYNMQTHKVVGSVVFVLKEGTTYRKIKINEFFGGYTFTYANWNGASWDADVTKTISNTTNQDKVFNYFSFATNDQIVYEPAESDWDLLFTKYKTPIESTSGTVMYNVTGVLSSPNVKVAKNTTATVSVTDLSDHINKIGSDWKTFTGTAYTVNSATNYFVKYNASDSMYKINFNTFEGSSTGVITFNVEDVTGTLSVQEVAPGVSFDVYPNPTQSDKIINVVYDITSQTSNKNSITIYSMNGSKVFSNEVSNESGFYNQQINLGNLASGIYMLEFSSGTNKEVKKIILK